MDALLDFITPAVPFYGGAPLEFGWVPPPQERQATLGGGLPLSGFLRAVRNRNANLGGSLVELAGQWTAEMDFNLGSVLSVTNAGSWESTFSGSCLRRDEWANFISSRRESSPGWRKPPLSAAPSEDSWPIFVSDYLLRQDEWRKPRPGGNQSSVEWPGLSSVVISSRDGWNATSPNQVELDDIILVFPTAYPRTVEDKVIPLFLHIQEFGDSFAKGTVRYLLRKDEWPDLQSPRPGKSPYPYRPPEEELTPKWRDGLLDFGLVLWLPVTALLDFDPSLSFPIRPYYVIMTSATAVRLPDRTPIPLASAVLSWDWDSWDLNVALQPVGRSAYETLLAAEEIELNINDNVWRLLLESVGYNRAFGRNNYSAKAISRAAEIAAPRSPRKDFSNANARNLSQLAEQSLDSTGWSLTWTAADGLIPGGLWHFNGTPLAALSSLADRVDGYLLPHRTNRTISVLPKWNVLPWDWGDDDVNDIIPSSLIISLQSAPESYPGYNAAWLSGESQGILAKVYRAGTAGDISAPIQVDPLFTATDIVRAKGSGVLSETGKWTRYTMELPVSLPGGDTPLLDVGRILKIQDLQLSEQWIAVVTEINLSANWRDGLTIRQQLTLKRYHG